LLDAVGQRPVVDELQSRWDQESDFLGQGARQEACGGRGAFLDAAQGERREWWWLERRGVSVGGRVDAVHGVCGEGGWVGGCGRNGGFGEPPDQAGDGVSDGVGEVGGCRVWLLLLLGGRGSGV